jgi:hypothetical protein
MLAAGGTALTLAVILVVALGVFVLVAVGVQLAVGEFEGAFAGEASMERLAAPVPVPDLVRLLLRVAVGELDGDWDSGADDDGAAREASNGGSTTPRKKVWLGAAAIAVTLMLPLALTTRNTLDTVDA